MHLSYCSISNSLKQNAYRSKKRGDKSEKDLMKKVQEYSIYNINIIYTIFLTIEHHFKNVIMLNVKTLLSTPPCHS